MATDCLLGLCWLLRGLLLLLARQFRAAGERRQRLHLPPGTVRACLCVLPAPLCAPRGQVVDKIAVPAVPAKPQGGEGRRPPSGAPSYTAASWSGARLGPTNPSPLTFGVPMPDKCCIVSCCLVLCGVVSLARSLATAVGGRARLLAAPARGAGMAGRGRYPNNRRAAAHHTQVIHHCVAKPLAAVHSAPRAAGLLCTQGQGSRSPAVYSSTQVPPASTQ
jgi:hypothetical protein